MLKLFMKKLGTPASDPPSAEGNGGVIADGGTALPPPPPARSVAVGSAGAPPRAWEPPVRGCVLCLRTIGAGTVVVVVVGATVGAGLVAVGGEAVGVEPVTLGVVPAVVVPAGAAGAGAAGGAGWGAGTVVSAGGGAGSALCAVAGGSASATPAPTDTAIVPAETVIASDGASIALSWRRFIAISSRADS
jgi:hypothetical protein